MSKYRVIVGDCVESMRGLADQPVNCCVTSPPYFGLRDYGVDGQIGLEKEPDEYIINMVHLYFVRCAGCCAMMVPCGLILEIAMGKVSRC